MKYLCCSIAVFIVLCSFTASLAQDNSTDHSIRLLNSIEQRLNMTDSNESFLKTSGISPEFSYLLSAVEWMLNQLHQVKNGTTSTGSENMPQHMISEFKFHIIKHVSSENLSCA